MYECKAVTETSELLTVMLSTSSNALLRVNSSRELAKGRRRVGSSEEDRLVLVHPGVDKEERR